MKQLVLVLVASAAGIIALAAGLRPDTFYAGDPGVKLVAARNALAHPSRPFEISLPTIGTEHVPYVEPFFAVHKNHAHAVTSALFPLLSAPFLATFGLRGIYVLPALGFLLALVGCAWMATAIDSGRNAALTAAVAALATPFLFYGLEFWEHMPAVACAALATALFLRGWPFASGVSIGVAVLLRPEAGWFGLAVLVASPLLPRPAAPRMWLLAVAGALLAVAPFEIYTLSHFGTLAPPHISTNAGGLGEGWLASRAAIASSWFLRNTETSFWGVAPVVVGAAGVAGLRSPRKGLAFLWSVAIADVLLVFLTAPNDGGGQWGPRYLLFAYVPLAVLAGDGVDGLLRKNVAAGIALAAVLLGCGWVQRSAYRHLRSTKVIYGAIVDFVAREVPPAAHAVTDLWWLDQIAAATTSDRQLFYADTPETAHTIMHHLDDAGVSAVTVVRSASESPDTSAWADGTCYTEERRDRISPRNLVAVRLRRACR